LSTLYLRLPSRAAFDSTAQWEAMGCPYALADGPGAIRQEGVAALAQLSALTARASRVVMVVAASDVTLLRVNLPPMSAARQRAALPNLVEEELVTDPAECVVVGGALADGLRTVAVTQRAWLERMARIVLGSGHARIAAVPAQMCLPAPNDHVHGAVLEQDADIEIALRTAPQEGLGLPLLPDQFSTAAREAIEAALTLAGARPLQLAVPQERFTAYQAAVAELGAAEHVTLTTDAWGPWIAGAMTAGIDLATGLGAALAPKMNWRPWRWPLVLAALLLLVNIVPLNIEWLRAKREYDMLRASMTQIYRSAFPNETVVVDPMAQMRQKLAAGRRNAGQAGPEDFTALAAAFGEAWSSAAGGNAPTIAGLEYRDRSLTIKLRPDAQVPFDKVKAALSGRALELTAAPEQPGVVVWQLRSAK
jgi:general secretion pathway protein L